jgi:DNA-directed RNA polymerase subunit RPC12/RpoP
MKLLKCLICAGEVDVVGNERNINKKIRCRQCGFNNVDEPAKKEPEVLIIRRRPGNPDTN